MKSFTNQQKFMAVILAIYVPSHLLAFYVYYNPPNDPWVWVDKITAIFPQMNNLIAFRAPFYEIGGRLAMMLSVTYLPMLIVGILLFTYWIKHGTKKKRSLDGFKKAMSLLFFLIFMIALHYLNYWTSMGFGRKIDLLHPLLSAWSPVMCGIILGAIVLGTYQLFNGENK